MVQSAEIAIIGAGPVGLVAALALARLNIAATVIAPPYDAALAAADHRTTALIGPSVTLLENLGVWEHCYADSSALAAVRIADDREAILRAPETHFVAQELGLASFGANIPNTKLLAALNAEVGKIAHITRLVTAGVTGIEPDTSSVRLRLGEGGAITARLVVAADGRNSIGPAAAGIATRSWNYPQAAIVTSFAHTRSHNGVVYELHRRNGPLTTVPLPGLHSSLVWVEEPRGAQRIAALSDDDFVKLLEDRLQGILGTVLSCGQRLVYPLSGSSTERMAAKRIVLVGEAAHVIPPIGAQGLNLGLKDAATMAECVADAQTQGQDVGGTEVLDQYHHARSGDVATRSAAIDLLNRSLLTEFLPLDVLRGAAVHALANSSTLQHFLMHRGLGAAGPLPRLMRPNAPLASP